MCISLCDAIQACILFSHTDSEGIVVNVNLLPVLSIQKLLCPLHLFPRQILSLPLGFGSSSIANQMVTYDLTLESK